MGGLGLHLDDTLEGVLELVQVMVVPPRHQFVALVGVRPRPDGRSPSHVHEADVRNSQIFGRTRGDGHGPGAY